MMKRILAATLFSLAMVTVAFAQQAPPLPEGILIKQQIFQGPEGGPPPPHPDGNFVFMASESFGGKVVKGAPYSADAVTETIQTLADGNRIVNRITSQMYRDSEGRTRREQNFKGLGLFGPGEEPPTTIFINDPVAGVTFVLDTKTHTAVKSLPFRFELSTKPGAPNTFEGQRFEYRVAGPEGAGGQNVVIAGAPPMSGGVRVAHPEMDSRVRGELTAASTYVLRTQHRPNPNEVKEQLGKQIIEGVEAEGTRTTVTIPAGEIGNERPIESVTERWYSPELQIVVMTRQSDPRFGETTYKLTNINRAEPAKSLFEVPAGFNIKEGPQFGPPNIAPLPRKKVNPE